MAINRAEQEWPEGGTASVEQILHQTTVMHCTNCGSCAEHVAIMALFAGIDNPVCCDESNWEWQN